MNILPIGYVNGTNPCFVYYLRAKDCINTESFYRLMCREQIEDFNECRHQKRHRAFRSWYAEESRKMKIISVPRYDDVTDSFVDGPLPRSVDGFFNNEDKMKEFFEIKKGQPKQESHHVSH